MASRVVRRIIHLSLPLPDERRATTVFSLFSRSLADRRGSWKLVGLFRTVALILLSATPESGLSHIDMYGRYVYVYVSGCPMYGVIRGPRIRMTLIYRVENVPMGGLWVSR